MQRDERYAWAPNLGGDHPWPERWHWHIGTKVEVYLKYDRIPSHAWNLEWTFLRIEFNFQHIWLFHFERYFIFRIHCAICWWLSPIVLVATASTKHTNNIKTHPIFGLRRHLLLDGDFLSRVQSTAIVQSYEIGREMLLKRIRLCRSRRDKKQWQKIQK